jgi:hypothetical protein
MSNRKESKAITPGKFIEIKFLFLNCAGKNALRLVLSYHLRTKKISLDFN